MENSVTPLAGLSILIVEDEALVAMMLEDMLQDVGCQVALAGSIEEAMTRIGRLRLDGVLLDMNIHGSPTVVVAEELRRRSVPFLLLTGYEEKSADPPVIKAASRLRKPFTGEDLKRHMVRLFVPPAAQVSA